MSVTNSADGEVRTLRRIIPGSVGRPSVSPSAPPPEVTYSPSDEPELSESPSFTWSESFSPSQSLSPSPSESPSPSASPSWEPVDPFRLVGTAEPPEENGGRESIVHAVGRAARLVLGTSTKVNPCGECGKLVLKLRTHLIRGADGKMYQVSLCESCAKAADTPIPLPKIRVIRMERSPE